MSITAAIIVSIAIGLALSLPFYFITRYLNGKHWEWEETGKYLREMNHVSLVISIALFIVFFVLFVFIFGIGVTV